MLNGQKGSEENLHLQMMYIHTVYNIFIFTIKVTNSPITDHSAYCLCSPGITVISNR